MARLSRKAQLLVRWWGELRVRELIKELRIACATCTYTELRPVVYPSAEQREALFRLGVDVKQVDGGFPSRAELAAFISNARAQVQAFQASLGPDQPREVADGKAPI